MHIIAAKAVSFKEALSDEFKTYQQQVVSNAQALARSLTDSGVKLVSGGTDNHLMLVDLTNDGITGKELEKLLDEVPHHRQQKRHSFRQGKSFHHKRFAFGNAERDDERHEGA